MIHERLKINQTVVACNTYCVVNLFSAVVELFSHIWELAVSTVHSTTAARFFFSRLTLLTYETSPGEL